jgi:hypothetical protein
MRIGMLALGSHRKDGYAKFDKGELQQLLDVKNEQQLSNELKKAKQHGWIGNESNATCLVVPAYAVMGGL